MTGWLNYVTGWVLWGLAAVGASTVLRWFRHDRVTPLLHDSAEQERLWPGQDHGRWPDCADPPCDFEDNYACVLHRPRCRGSLDDQPAAFIRAAVMATDRRKP